MVFSNFSFDSIWIDNFFFSAVFYRICAVSNLSELLWVVGINDFVLKFTSVIVKIGIIFVPSHMLQHRKRVIEIDWKIRGNILRFTVVQLTLYCWNVINFHKNAFSNAFSNYSLVNNTFSRFFSISKMKQNST